MSKHTPGPWRTFNVADVFPDDGDTEGGRQIADCAVGELIGFHEAAANARLIAAAPDLLEALKDMVLYCDMFPNAPYHVKAKAAIAKAEGRSP